MTRWFYVAVGLTLLAFAASAYVYFFRFDALPEKIPTHWNFQGEPDAWTAKADSGWVFWAMPVGISVLLALMPILPRISPRHFEVNGFRSLFEFVMAMTIGLLIFLHVTILFASLRGGDAPYLGRMLFGGVVAFLGLIGLCLPKVQRNFWMGVRTPWTLASDQVWRSTHRVAAYTFAIGAVVCLALIVAGVPLEWCIAGLIGFVAIPVVYSLVYYKWLERHGRLDTV